MARKEICVCLIRIANKQLKVVESTTQMTAYEVTIHLSEASQLIAASHKTSFKLIFMNLTYLRSYYFADENGRKKKVKTAFME